MMELVRPAREWYDDRLELARLVAWFEERGGPPVDGFSYLLEKPWKFAPEYREMCAEEEQERLLDEHAALEDEAWRDMQRRSSL